MMSAAVVAGRGIWTPLRTLDFTATVASPEKGLCDSCPDYTLIIGPVKLFNEHFFLLY